ncbi:hypothetical protein [Dinghuibacter silviterrae]|uniref:Uncharacterized protein n=1 Tax=Dinghuibacter silviterrae TaxID=1539049 RepID=A0A4R8DW88_9BACT|nr:hypothetical protein [Dinghuibacter silviterrae]TDX01481.1 hypothetical protein EDB95_2517 [Dinghuibacter silviterrae]
MLGILGAADEYNNAGALIGLDATDNAELLGALRKMNPIQRQRTINKLSNTGHPSRGSRSEMEKHFSELPQYIKDGLSKGDLRLADTVIYSIKLANSKTVKMFETQDDRQIGLRNISNAKLPKNQALLVSGVILLAGVSVDQTPDNIMSTNFAALENIPALATGETDLKANKKQIFPETSNAVFKTTNFHSVPLGYYKLANPRLILDDILIELTVQLGTVNGIAANTYLYAGLHGTITTP